jgi:RNA polymerase sigma-70 factor (ECF subfamily)
MIRPATRRVDFTSMTDFAESGRYEGSDTSCQGTLGSRSHSRLSWRRRRRLRHSLQAEDLTQETFFQILRTIHRINDSFNFSAWIHRIATNLCYDELRRRKKFPEAQEIDDEENEDSVLQVPDGDARKSPEVALEISELRDAVWSVARRLPEKYRLVLTLRELQGLSYANIARKMRVSESAVETLLHRARRRFKEEYLFMEGKAQTEETRCPTIAYLLDNFPPGTLRREQRKMVAQHLDSCPACSERYPNPPHLQRNDVVVQLNTAVVTRRLTSKVRHPKISFMDGRVQGGYRKH